MSKKAAVNRPTNDPVTIARAEVERLNGQELGMALLYREKAKDLASVKAARADQVLDAADPAGAAREIGRVRSGMREELEALADASRRARERRLAAIPAVFAAEAEQADRAAAQLDADAAQLEAESARLRKALEAHDDCEYSPTRPNPPERFAGNPQGGAPVVVYVRVPRHERIRLAAREKRSEAMQAQRKQPHAAGMLEADDIEQLLAAVFVDAMRVAPPVDAIIDWAEQVVEKEQRRRARLHSTAVGYLSADAPVRLHLEWRNGSIDPAASGIVQPELAGVRDIADSPAELRQLAGTALSDEPRAATSADPYGIETEALPA